jgi:CubicO group peptidase (beta-lactamase class C family)
MKEVTATLFESARVCLCSILLLSLAQPVMPQSRTAAARTSKPDFSSTRKLIQERMAADSIPSVSVAVVRKGEILWEEGFGWADRDNRIPATPHTMYYLASVTKSITATAVMMLNERKKLDLDRPVNDYLRPAKVSSPLWDPSLATVRGVATHMAGLTTYARSCYRGPQNCRISLDESVERYGILFWPPGDHFDYSNLGYTILGAVVANASGHSYADFLRNELFRPLGMKHASLGIDPALEKYAAKRYSNELGLRPTAISGTPGASGVYCSAHDLALFGEFHLKAHRPGQKAILSDTSIDAMKEATSEQYGFGWWIRKDLFGYRSVMGQGGTDDASATLQLIPSEEIAVVVLANTGTTLPSAVVNEVLSTLLPTYREKLAEASGAKTSDVPKTNLPAPGMVGTWIGNIRTYRGNVQLTFSITASGEVQGRLGSQAPTALKNCRFSDDSFTGLMAGNLPTLEDTGDDPYDLDFELYLRGSALNGAVTTRPHPRARNFARLPFWVELKKER